MVPTTITFAFQKDLLNGLCQFNYQRSTVTWLWKIQNRFHKTNRASHKKFASTHQNKANNTTPYKI